MPKLDQKGAIPFLLVIAGVAILAFVLFSSVASFKNRLFSYLYPKPPSYAAPTTNTVYSIVLNQQSPHFGDSINFTAVYPKEATRSITTVQHENPDVLMSCYQNSVVVYNQVFVFPTEKNNKDGTLTGISNFNTLSANGGNGIAWPGGAATCYAGLYYFGKDGQIHVLAQQRDIYVAP